MIGGQALIEGILMRGPSRVATVVRKPDGSMDISEKPCKVRKGRPVGFSLCRHVCPHLFE